MPNFVYSDINLSIIKNPNTDDIVLRYDLDAIRASIKAILLTMPGEKLFNPAFGCGLNRLLFELITPATEILAKKTISEQLLRYEPRIKIQDVSITDDGVAQLNVTVTFSIVQYPGVVANVTITLERVR